MRPILSKHVKSVTVWPNGESATFVGLQIDCEFCGFEIVKIGCRSRSEG